MKKLLLVAGVSCCCFNVNAQNTIDNYTNSTNVFTEIATSAQGLNAPHDLDFVPGRPGECWVLNKETDGGSVVLLFNAGKAEQTHQFRRDSHNEHFMARATAIAFGANDFFGTAQEIIATTPGATFMGPALWNSDTTVFARMHQNNWVNGQLLGSHIDMLHQSPYGMGIAHDNANVYWYFDGYNNNICKYDFATPHGVGEDDHSDGKIHRYTDVTVTRKPNVPSHMVVDKANSWLYYADAGSGRVMRMKTTSGTIGGNLTPPQTSGEPLAEYKAVTGATKEIMVSGLTSPCGVDYRNDRLVVSDYATGNIYLYNTTTVPATLVGTIITGGPGVMGVRMQNDNKIWFVNATTNKLYRIDNPNVVSVEEAVAQEMNYKVYPNPAQDNINIRLDDVNVTEKALIRIFDMSGRQVYTQITGEQVTTVDVSAWATGMYHVILSHKNNIVTTKVMVQ